MSISQKQISSVVSLKGQQRYEYFVKMVVDREEAWGLYQDGWALAATENGQQVFPLWPAKEYAQLCVNREWMDYVPAPIPLVELMNDLLPKLRADGILPGVFYTPSDVGVTPTIDQLLEDLNEELENY